MFSPVNAAGATSFQLEIADLEMEDLNLEGSCHIQARNIMGRLSQGILRYSQQTGKCVLKRVRVKNKGINRHVQNCYWKNRIKRHQALTILLEGHSEFYAEDVAFNGNQTIIVPDGERWVARQDGTFLREKAGWEWRYCMKGDQVLSGHNFS